VVYNQYFKIYNNVYNKDQFLVFNIVTKRKHEVGLRMSDAPHIDCTEVLHNKIKTKIGKEG
jgi:hypothetical protein